MSTTFEYQGFDVLANWSGALTSSMANDAFAMMATSGSNSVGISTKLFLDSGSSSNFVTAAVKSTTDATLVAGIKAAQAKGLKVLLEPHVQTLDGKVSYQLAPSDPNAFFAAYKAQIVHLASIAQQTGVDTLSIGNEMSTLSGSAYRAQWLDVIADVRKVYTGKLTYEAATFEAGAVSFWDKVDMIGFNAYASLSAGKDPSVADLVKAWTTPPVDSYQAQALGNLSVIDFMKSLATTTGKPLLITEVGYRSIDGGATNPSQWDRAGTADQTDQANAFKALFQVLQSYGGSWLAGMQVWGANIDGSPAGYATDYSVAGKAAGSVVQQYFTGTGSVTGLTVTGSAGADLVDIGSGDDTIATGLGDDVIKAGAGNDTIVAGPNTLAPNKTTTVTLTGYGAAGQVALLVNGQQIGGTATFNAAADSSGYQTYTFTFANPAAINSLDLQLVNAAGGGTAMIRGLTINGATVTATDVTNKFRAGTLDLTNGSLHMDATRYRDWFYGSGSDNDTIQGGAGNDTIDGGAGIDTALYTGSFADYTLSRSGAALVVADSKAGRDGTDSLRNVEFLRFRDGTVAVASLLLPDAADSSVASFAARSTTPSGLMAPTLLGSKLVAAGTGANLTAAGLSAAGATVTLSEGSMVLGQVTADRTGAFSVSVASLSAGVHRLTATAALGALGSAASDTAVAVVGTAKTILGLIVSSAITPQVVVVTDAANPVVGTVDQLSQASWGLAAASTPLTLGVADTAANVTAALGYLGSLTNLGGITLNDSHALPVATVADMNAIIASSTSVLGKIVGGYTFALKQAGSNGNVITTAYDAAGAQLSQSVLSLTSTGKAAYTTFKDGSTAQQTYDSSGQLVADLLRRADGTRDQWDYGITGRTYTSDHLSWNKAGTLVQLDRFDQPGRLASSQSTAADGTVTLDSYTAGVLGSRTITKATGASETRTFNAAGTMVSDFFRNADGTRDQYDYGITGQPHTSDHISYDTAGKAVRVDKFDAAGRLTTSQVNAVDGSATLDSYTVGTLATRTITKATGAVEIKTFSAAGTMTSDYFKNADGSRELYDYGVTGQAYTSDHLSWDSTGRVTRIDRFDAAGRYTTSQVTAADGTVTLDTYTTGLLSSRLLTKGAASELKTFTRDGQLSADLFRYADGTKEQYDFGISGQPYTSDHIVWNKAGTAVRVERFDRTGVLYTSQTIASDGTATLDSYKAGALASRLTSQTNGNSDLKTFAATGQVATDLLRYADGSKEQFDYGCVGRPYTSDHLIWDKTGRLVEVLQYRAGGGIYSDTTTSADNTVTAITYDTGGRKAQGAITYANGASDVSTFDANGAVSTRSVTDVSGSRHFTTNGITGQPYTSQTVNVDAKGVRQSIVQQNADGSQNTSMYASGVSMLFDHAVDKILSAGGDTFRFAATPFRSTIQNFQGGSGSGHDTIVLSKSLATDFSRLGIATAGQNTTVSIDSQHSLVLNRPVGQLVAANFSFV